MPDIVIYLKETIRLDWAEVNFIIGTNPDDLIELKFEKSEDAEIGLKAYMNNLITSHEIISQFNLKRVLQYWGHTDSTYIYYMLMPPWIKQRVADVYEQVILKENLQQPPEDKSKRSIKLYSSDINM